MEIDGENPVGTGLGDQIGDQLGRDRGPATGLPVLSGIAEIGDDSGDPAGTGADQRVNADQQFHQVVIGRVGGRLQDEDILAAHVLVDPHEDLAIGESFDLGGGQGCVEIVGDGPGQVRIGSARHQLHRFDPRVFRNRGLLNRGAPGNEAEMISLRRIPAEVADPHCPGRPV